MLLSPTSLYDAGWFSVRLEGIQSSLFLQSLSAEMLNLNITARAAAEADENLAVVCSVEHVTFGIKQLKQLTMHSFRVNITNVKDYLSALRPL